MKKALQIISVASIIILFILFIMHKFMEPMAFNSADTRSIFVLIYLFSSMKFYQMDSKDKEATIEELTRKLEGQKA